MVSEATKVDVEKLANRFLKDVYELPEGEKIKTCIQCGTCSGSCPTSYIMDYTPREIIAALRAGMLDRVVKSNTMWVCTSCYYCTVRCPMGIRVTDLMYELKRLAIHYRIYPRRALGPELSKMFVDMIDRNGRISDGKLSTKFILKKEGIGGAVGMLPIALKLIRQGKFTLHTEKVNALKDLERISDSISASGSD